MINEKEFLETASLETLFAAFVNCEPDDNGEGFNLISKYTKNKFHEFESENFVSINNELMKQYFDLDFVSGVDKQGKKVHSFFIVTKDSSDVFFEKIYLKIQNLRVHNHISDIEFEQKMLLSFFMLRGSHDFNNNWYAVDIKESVTTEKYLDLLFKLLTNVKDIKQLNWNFRDVQPQQVSGESNRDNQLRINLRYFYDMVKDKAGSINKYRYLTLKNNECKIKNIAKKSNFINRLLFYRDNVLNKIKTPREIEQLRKELGFEYDTKIDNKVKRNQSIVQYVRVYFPDECAACKQQYHIADRSFKYRNSERYYMEVHHCISFSADNTCDQIDNLVKLCPTCHRALTKNRADEIYQRELITRIFDNAPEAKLFCLNFVENENQLVDFVYERLR